jgi:alpha-ketoglutarate-dependent taurine dioxygenase
LRSYVLEGERRLGRPSTGPRAQALAAIDAAIEESSRRDAIEVKLLEGEIIFIDNTTVLHGRTAFQDQSGHSRLMLRTWIDGAS